MAFNYFLNHLQDLDFTNEEQGVVFTPSIQWDSSDDDSTLLVIGKMISSKSIDDNVMIRAFQDDWLALGAFNPNYSIDDFTFTSMNIKVHIYGVPSILMDDDNIAHHSGDSLGAMIPKGIKVDTRRIDLNMVDYLRIGIVLDVTKSIRRCVAIGVTSPPKLCPLQYERLPTLRHGCGIIGHSLEFCSTFKPMPSSELQYNEWIRYIPPWKQEANPRSKGSIRYLNVSDISNPKTIVNGKTMNIPQHIEAVKVRNKVADAKSTNVLTILVAVNTIALATDVHDP
ncbi:hypothetical protein V6N13_074670 [Hibiscus sabdariffa]